MDVETKSRDKFYHKTVSGPEKDLVLKYSWAVYFFAAALAFLWVFAFFGLAAFTFCFLR